MRQIKHLFFTLLLLLPAIIVSGQKNEYNIIPEPLQLKPAAGQFTFNTETSLFAETPSSEEIVQAFSVLVEHLQTAAGIELRVSTTEKSGAVVCRWNKNLPKKESYKLQIDKNKITVEARESVGFFYAAQTIRQLLPAAIESQTLQNDIQWTVPCCQIEDTPHYDYRGMHLDVCRHFSSKEEVMRHIDQLAFLKLNTFHWHLTDDQGWRIEIKKYPRLTEIGGFRNRTVIGHYNDTPRRWDYTVVGGYYTQEEIKEVVAYAQKRFVTILPEIEMPGHAVAALAAYPQYSCTGGPFEVEGLWGVFNDVYCTREETFDFLEDILDEVTDLFPNEYIHIGGDECPKLRWTRCHACQERMKAEGLKDEHELQSYFVNRMANYLKTKGKRIVGWDEILEGGLTVDNAVVMSWRGTEGGIAAARQGHDVIMTPSSALYLDYYQSQLPSEPLAIGGYLPLQTVYEYNPTPAQLTPDQAKHIWGVQANLWTEYIANQKHREYMIFPRILALAENAWLPQSKKNYPDFQHRLASLFRHYDVMDVNYSRAFYNVMGNSVVQNGQLGLALHSADPKMAIHYTTDGSQATLQTPLYVTPIALGKTALTVNALPVSADGKALCEPYQQSFIANKAAGQKVMLSNQPGEKYKGKGPVTLVDCITGRYPLMGSEWLGFLGEDVEVIIEFDRPVEASKITVGSANYPGQWIYAPQSVECLISEDGINFRSIGQKAYDDMLTAGSKAVLEMPIQQVKQVKAVVKNFGVIPEGEQGGGNRAWLFLDEIIVE